MRASGYQILFGADGGAEGLRGSPRLRVRGAWMRRWERFREPILRGVKRAEEVPVGALGLEEMPFPGREASAGVTEPMVDGEAKRAMATL